MFDGKAFGEEIVGIVQDYVERAVAPLKAENEDLKARLKALEDRPAPEIILPELPELPELPDFGKMIADAVQEAVDSLPTPENGKDGVGVGGAVIDRSGHLILTLTNGETRDIGPVVGKDGEPGFGLDDFDCQPVDERTIKMTFVRGEVAHSYELQFPVVVYRGVYQDGREYERGDTVTWGGSLWHCDTPTKEKPGTDNWTLAAKRGRDGKDLTKDA